MWTEAELKGRLLKQAAKELASMAISEEISGRKICVASLPGTDRSVLTDLAESVKSEGGVALIAGITDTLSVIMASGDKAVDCRKILPDIKTPPTIAGGVFSQKTAL